MVFRTFDPAIGFEPRKPEKVGFCSVGNHWVSLNEVRRDINGREVCSIHFHVVEKSYIPE